MHISEISPKAEGVPPFVSSQIQVCCTISRGLMGEQAGPNKPHSGNSAQFQAITQRRCSPHGAHNWDLRQHHCMWLYSVTSCLAHSQNQSLRKKYYWWHKCLWVTEQWAPPAPKGPPAEVGLCSRGGAAGKACLCLLDPVRGFSALKDAVGLRRPGDGPPRSWQCWHWWPRAPSFSPRLSF